MSVHARFHPLAAAALLGALVLPSAAQAQEQKFAVALFHFNLQYTAGGLEGLLPGELDNLFPGWELNQTEVEDMIIEESFEPVLDLYLRHPGWGVDLELQGYFIEVLVERHPDVLAKLIELQQNGQASVISFHYSDQLFIGYGRPAWEHSIALTEEMFDAVGLEKSTTVFCQEGQASVGMAGPMAEHGLETLVWPKNLWSYQHGDWEPAPYYNLEGLDMVAGSKGVNYNNGELQLTWTFLDDGELLATCDIDPYFPPVFKTRPRCVREYEQELEQLEADGWDIATVKEYVDAAKGLGIPPEEPPPLFDGTWQPSSTEGVFRWLGGVGLWALDERDNVVRTQVAIAYRELMAAQTMVEQANLSRGEEMHELWRLMNLAMVTDATGVNPYKGEVGYGLATAGEVLRRARAIIDEGKAALGAVEVAIDTEAGEVRLEAAPVSEAPWIDDPVGVQIDGGNRTIEAGWTLESAEPELYRLELTFGAGREQSLSITFPGNSSQVVFTPALTDDTLTYDRGDFVFDSWPMALPNGLINLSDDLWVIKDTGLVHLAAFISTSTPDVTFRDQTAIPDSPVTWRFYVMRGTREEALAFANGLNLYPTLYR